MVKFFHAFEYAASYYKFIIAKVLNAIINLSITMSRSKSRAALVTMQQEYIILKSKLEAYLEVSLSLN